MKASELRIGNYIHYKTDGTDSVIEFENFEFISRLPQLVNDLFNPIPLTEEWLLKFGFDKIENGFKQYWDLNGFQIEIHGDKFPVRIWGGESAPHLTQFIGHKTKHVHQLQNLYFALSGEELTIKP